MKSPSPTTSTALRLVLWGEFLLLAVNLIWSCVCLGAYRPETQLVTFTLTALLALLHFGVRSSCWPQGEPLGWGDYFLLGFLLYGLGSVCWLSPYRWLGVLDLLGWAQLFLVFWVVRRDLNQAPFRLGLLGVLYALGFLAVFLACYQRFVDAEWLMLGRRQASQFLGRCSGFFGIPNSFAGFLLLLLPVSVLGVFRKRLSLTLRLFLLYSVLVFGLGLVLSISRGAWLALVLVLCAQAWLSRSGGWLRRLSWVALSLVFSAAALWGLCRLNPAVHERVSTFIAERGETSRPILWRASLRLAADNPVFGSGAGSFNVLFEKHRPEHFQREPQWVHNDYLNTLSDYGLFGTALLGTGILLLILRERKKMRMEGKGDPLWFRHGLLLGLVAFGLQLSVDFHLKLAGLAMAFAVVAALACCEASQNTVVTESRRRWQFALPALGVLLALLLFWTGGLPLLRSEALRYQNRQRLDSTAAFQNEAAKFTAALHEIEIPLRTAVALDPSNAQAATDLAYLLCLRTRHEPALAMTLALEAEKLAKSALVGAPAWIDAWVCLGMALDIQGKWVDGGLAFAEALKLAPASANMRYYLAYHYAQRTSTRANALAFLATCLRLDPAHAPAQALREQLEAVGKAH